MLGFAGFTIEIIVLLVILGFQVYYFVENQKKRNELKSIFSGDIDDILSIEQNEDGVSQIAVEEEQSDLLKEEIIEPINSYLEKNKGATDYHIIKDLTDRACDKIQDEIDSYNPVPLYLGLCGTMFGVIIGIFFLWLSGGLDSLLASNAITEGLPPEQVAAAAQSASAGIQHLLGGVAIAMFASLCGVILTIWGTHKTKAVVASNETGRNDFLSWIQCNLLPKMSSDVVSTLGVFYQNLNQFNSTFSQNSRELRKAFETIQSAYAGQTEYTKELNKLDIGRAQIAFAALGSATEKINDLNEFLTHSSDYLRNVVALADKLDTADERTKAIESMGAFFRNEIEQIDARKSLLSETIGKIDLNLKQSLEGLQTSTTEEVGKLQIYLNKVYIDFKTAVEEQQTLLEKKLSESSLYLDQFKHLETIEQKLASLLTKDVYSNIETTKNGKLDRIEIAINRLAELLSKRPASVASKTAAPSLFDNQTQPDIKVNLPVPKWLAYTTCVVLILAGLFSIAYPLIQHYLLKQ